MPSTYSQRERLELQATGENDTTWGTKANIVFQLIDEALSGYLSISAAGTGDLTLTASNGLSDEVRQNVLDFTGVLTGNRNIIVPTEEGEWFVVNNTTGAFTLTVKTAAGTGISITQGFGQRVFCDGTNVLASGPGIVTSTGVFGSTDFAGDISVTGDISATGNISAANGLSATSADDGASSGPILDLYRNSASPAAFDDIGVITLSGENSVSAKTDYANIFGEIVDPTNTSESGRIVFSTIISGSIAVRAYVGDGVYSIGATGGDQGADTLNFSGYYIDGVNILARSNQWTADQTIRSDDAGAGIDPNLNLYRNSASPAANDLLGAVNFQGKDSLGNTEDYAKIVAEIIDPTSGSEDGSIQFQTVVAGAVGNRLKIGQGIWADGATGGDQGADTFNASQYYVDGVLISVADQAAMEAGTSTTVSDLVTPGRQHFHESASKAWVQVGSVTGTPSIRKSYNATSITNVATGRMTVNWSITFSDSNYAVSVTPGEDTPGGGNGTKGQYDGNSLTTTTTPCTFQDNNNNLTDPDDFTCIIFGDL